MLRVAESARWFTVTNLKSSGKVLAISGSWLSDSLGDIWYNSRRIVVHFKLYLRWPLGSRGVEIWRKYVSMLFTVLEVSDGVLPSVGPTELNIHQLLRGQERGGQVSAEQCQGRRACRLQTLHKNSVHIHRREGVYGDRGMRDPSHRSSLSARVVEAHVASSYVLPPDVVASEAAHEHGTHSHDRCHREHDQRGPVVLLDGFVYDNDAEPREDCTEDGGNESVL